MKTERTTEVSALFDGELEAHEVRPAIKASLNDSERWRLYGLIGDGLRGDCPDARDLTASVMSRLSEEPVVLAPRALATRQRQHPLLALAASVAGVAVVGWLALVGNPQAPVAGQSIAVNSPATVASAATPGLTLVAAPEKHPMQADISEYLLAHHAQVPAGHLQDSTQQIRTVGLIASRP